MIIVNNIKLSLDTDLNDVYSVLASKLKIPYESVTKSGGKSIINIGKTKGGKTNG